MYTQYDCLEEFFHDKEVGQCYFTEPITDQDYSTLYEEYKASDFYEGCKEHMKVLFNTELIPVTFQSFKDQLNDHLETYRGVYDEQEESDYESNSFMSDGSQGSYDSTYTGNSYDDTCTVHSQSQSFQELTVLSCPQQF